MRPLPPIDALEQHSAAFFPDQEGLGAWVFETIINDEGELHNPAHQHLADASIGWIWTNALHVAHGRQVVGQARLITPPQERWGKAMADWQLRQWFGHLPDFVITLSAPYAMEADDTSFCALVEHELYHCAQAEDEFGSPRFRKDGSPMFAMKGHDVEEFVGVVERYGVNDPALARMVAAANEKPSIGIARVAEACGTCLFRRAA